MGRRGVNNELYFVIIKSIRSERVLLHSGTVCNLAEAEVIVPSTIATITMFHAN